MNTLFNMDVLPVTQAAPKYHYHLYFEKDNVRHYLRNCRGIGLARRWEWQTDDAAGKRWKRKTYRDSASATRAQRAWQRRAKDGLIVRIEGCEVMP